MTYQSKVMTVYILGLFMTIIDGTMVNVALPTMADDFGVPTTDIEWIAVGYLLTYAAGIRRSGRRCCTGRSRWPTARRRRSAS